MKAVKGGNGLDPIKHIYNKYKNDIYKYLFYLTKDPYIAEDLTQETFIGAFKSIHKFKGESKVSTWLFQIAKYTYYNFLRKQKKDDKIIDYYLFENDGLDNNSPEYIYNEKEENKMMLHALKQLKQPKQHIVILRIYNDLSFKEIGEIFQQSEVWARVNFYRAKNELGVFLERGEGNDE